jgi:2-oxoglutarate dehydrogenase E2 component (dihydrolipoamide succinyltransferase)
MPMELRIPEVGESIREVEIGQWLKQEGDRVAQDENVVEIETEKATVELPAPASGVIAKILKQQGEAAEVGEVIGMLETAEERAEAEEEAPRRQPARKQPTAPRQDEPTAKRGEAAETAKPPRSAEKSAAEEVAAAEAEVEAAEVSAREQATEKQKLQKRGERKPAAATAKPDGKAAPQRPRGPTPPTPAAERKRAAPEPVWGEASPFTDEPDTAAEPTTPPVAREALPASRPTGHEAARPKAVPPPEAEAQRPPQEEVVPMSYIRRRIAARLVEAQQNAALLTTFNEVDMTAVQELRRELQPAFQERYGVKLGLMSFFVKATIDALNELPELNAQIRDGSIVYRRYCHIGIAIGGGRGLVVPVLRHAEQMSFADIERTIADLAARARDNKLKPEELEGGTFTISNGGIYGSMLSTPIVNPPQSGILGMHAIQDRPVARGGQVVIRPMMYLALTYDHRLVDGREAVTFLRRIVECIQQPARMLLEA